MQPNTLQVYSSSSVSFLGLKCLVDECSEMMGELIYRGEAFESSNDRHRVYSRHGFVITSFRFEAFFYLLPLLSY
jgi:hypothetical protein